MPGGRPGIFTGSSDKSLERYTLFRGRGGVVKAVVSITVWGKLAMGLYAQAGYLFGVKV